jgi:hypothetical protein
LGAFFICLRNRSFFEPALAFAKFQHRVRVCDFVHLDGVHDKKEGFFDFSLFLALKV